MRNTAKILLAALLATSAGSAMAAPRASSKAATPAAKATAAPPAAAQEQDAMLYLKVMISGLQSDKVEEPVKSALVGCIYNNSLSKITESMDKVIAENPGKVDKSNPSQVLGVMARICGYEPKAPAGAAPAPGPTPAPTTGNAPTGR